MNKFWSIKKMLRSVLQGAVLGLLLAAGSAYAADTASAQDLVLNGDAKCTKCHDESDSPEVLAIGKTRHGTRADSRTPGCSSCHGDCRTGPSPSAPSPRVARHR
jgi:hypothetical protein